MKHIITAPSGAQEWVNGRDLREYPLSISAVSTGKMEESNNNIITSNLLKEMYVILVLDGYRILTISESLQENYILSRLFTKSDEEEPKETCHLKEGIALCWSSEYQESELSSVTSITGLIDVIARLASLKLWKLIRLESDVL